MARTTEAGDCWLHELCIPATGGGNNNGSGTPPSGGGGGTPTGGWTPATGSGTGNPPGGSGSGGNGTGNPPGGGGNNGGGWWNGVPCLPPASARTTSEPIAGCPPEWVPIIPYDENWFNSLQPYTIDVSELNPYPCVQGLVNSVLALNNSTIKAIKDLYNESTKFNLKFVPDPTIPGAASTNPSPGFVKVISTGQYQSLAYLNTTIKLNPSTFNTSTKFSIAESVIHEMIHAYFHYRRVDAWNDPAKTQLLESQLGFLRPWDPNNPSTMATASHEQMAQDYVNEIVKALKEFRVLTDSDLASWRTNYPNITLDDYYKAMAWGGLTLDPETGTYLTKGWKVFEDNNPTTAAMYRSIIGAEQDGNSMAISNAKCQ